MASTILKETSWFGSVSEDLQLKLAAAMKLEEVEDGHILVEEGEAIERFLIIESGVLSRTKKYLGAIEDGKERQSLRSMEKPLRLSSITQQSIMVDKIQGRGRVSGLLHIVQEDTLAYATITADGPAKIWSIQGSDFRDIISSSPAFSLEFMQSMSKELRSGSKSLRVLLENVHNAAGNDGSKERDPAKTCRILCYDATSWVVEGFKPAVQEFNAKQEDGYKIAMDFTTERLTETSASYAAGYNAVCLFVNDTANAAVMRTLSLFGVGMISLRCAGFDRIDTKAAQAYGLTVARVPAYSPYAVAEMAVALLMSVNRKIPKASSRIKMANFTLDSGLLGMDINGKTVGVMGTGKIGQILCQIMLGFGVQLLCYDVYESDKVKEMGGTYVSQDEIYAQSDVLFLMMPLLKATHHTINHDVLPKLKRGVILINTSRGGLVDTSALLDGLRSGIISGVGMDVYEKEQEYFFQDWSAKQIKDTDLEALMANNNVVLTAHQAFFTQEAVDKIVSTTIDNLKVYHKDKQVMSSHPNSCL